MAAVARDLASSSLDEAVVDASAAHGNLAVDIFRHPSLVRLRAEPAAEPATAPAWTCAELAGRLCELTAGVDSAALSAAVHLVRDAQRAGDPVAWITARAATFHPPDAAAAGVDLSALVVVRARDARTAGRAADVLLRSGAYGLVVLDLGTDAAMPTPLQGRLVQLALKHDAAVLCLTEKGRDDPSLGSLVSLRGQVSRRRAPGGFACRIDVLKDKRRGPGWRWREVRRGPDGLH
ncbi:MAG TPA: recombinase A [Candidatus Krumholzibacteria bacterium]|nr:recombinase A [Candidatus Krumholzibacteria bacterium]